MALRVGPILVALVVASAAPASACNVDDPVEIISGELHTRGAVTGVALVTVIGVDLAPTEAWRKGLEEFNWNASYKLKRTISGDVADSGLKGQRRSGPGACDYPFARAPKLGDVRVLYVFDSGVSYDVTPETAKLYDPELKGIIPAW